MIELIRIPENASTSEIGRACRTQNMKVLEAMNSIKHDRIQADIRRHACSGYILRGKTIVQFYTGDYRYGGFGAFVRYASSFGEKDASNGYTASFPSIDEVVNKLLTIRERDDKPEGQGKDVIPVEPCGEAASSITL